MGSLRNMLLLWVLQKIEQLPIEVKDDERNISVYSTLVI